MTLPGMPGSQVSNDADLMRIISDLQRDMREVKAQNILATAGITTQTNGVSVGGSLNVSGDANFTGNTTIGGTASITGNVTKTNGYGTTNLGPLIVGATGAPALTFTRAGTTYGAPCGIGLDSASSSDTQSQLFVSGPSTTPNGGYLSLSSNLSFVLAADNTGNGPQVIGTPGTGGAVSIYAGGTSGSVNIYPYGTGKCQVNGAFAVTGSKAFIMPHPLDPQNKTLMHASTESPVNGVEYWGTVTLDAAGQATATLPAYFEPLTKATGRNIQLTPIGRTAVQVSADRIVDGSFAVYGAPGQEVDWVVKAERQRMTGGVDALHFDAEINEPIGS